MSAISKLQSCPPKEPAEIPPHVQDTRVLVRERGFLLSTDAIMLMRALRDQLGIGRSTGTLLLDFNQGGIGGARFREEFSIDPNLKIIPLTSNSEL